MFRDDVDFGWRVARAGGRVVFAPAALLFHAEAASRGARQIDNTVVRPHVADRRAALDTLLVNCSTAAVPWQYVRLGLGSCSERSANWSASCRLLRHTSRRAVGESTKAYVSAYVLAAKLLRKLGAPVL